MIYKLESIEAIVKAILQGELITLDKQSIGRQD